MCEACAERCDAIGGLEKCAAACLDCAAVCRRVAASGFESSVADMPLRDIRAYEGSGPEDELSPH